jgi:hypothetical protein
MAISELSSSFFLLHLSLIFFDLLCCALLCSAVLCCAVLCSAVLYQVEGSNPILWVKDSHDIQLFALAGGADAFPR